MFEITVISVLMMCLGTTAYATITSSSFKVVSDVRLSDYTNNVLNVVKNVYSHITCSSQCETDCYSFSYNKKTKECKTYNRELCTGDSDQQSSNTLVFVKTRSNDVSVVTYFTSSTGMTRGKAKQYCDDHGGHLLVLDSNAKWKHFSSHQAYQDLTLSVGEYWISMTFDDSVVECDAKAKDEPWRYTGWGRWASENREPNRCSYQYCVKLSNSRMRSTECISILKAICKSGCIDSTIN
ncbi:uncharacterized protein [Argopecten irradians]|uniref:uncharacterized protein n=1 Tax=Argopecten irradians TaxID=31199 RepID=UPI0037168DC1